MASVMIQGDDGKIVVHVWYSIVTGEVLYMQVGKIVFVDKDAGVLMPGWKRALVRQAVRRPHIDFGAFSFWTDELEAMAAQLRHDASPRMMPPCGPPSD